MKAIIFAAGRGSRLGKITDTRPKALVEIGGITMLEHAIQNLKKHSVNEIIINVHHFADQIEEFLKMKRNFNIRLEISNERENLLETGGGLIKASWFFDDKNPFLTYNVDILTNLDISSMVKFHTASDALVSLAGKIRETQRYFISDQNHRLCGWENIKTGESINSLDIEGKAERVGYSGISIMSPRIFELIVEKGAFTLTPVFLRLAGKHRLMVYRHDNDYWTDIGSPKRLKEAETYFG